MNVFFQAIVDAVLVAQFTEEDKTPAQQVWAAEQKKMRTPGRRVRAGVAGLVLGAAIGVGGMHLGRAVDDWLDGKTGGGWGFASGNGLLGDIGLVPFVFAGMGMMVSLTGAYRLLLAAFPALGGQARWARTVRVVVLGLFGAAAFTAAVVAGLAPTPR